MDTRQRVCIPFALPLPSRFFFSFLFACLLDSLNEALGSAPFCSTFKPPHRLLLLYICLFSQHNGECNRVYGVGGRRVLVYPLLQSLAEQITEWIIKLPYLCSFIRNWYGTCEYWNKRAGLGLSLSLSLDSTFRYLRLSPFPISHVYAFPSSPTLFLLLFFSSSSTFFYSCELCVCKRHHSHKLVKEKKYVHIMCI